MMNAEERVWVWFLAAFERLLNVITLGRFSKRQGEERIALYREAQDE